MVEAAGIEPASFDSAQRYKLLGRKELSLLPRVHAISVQRICSDFAARQSGSYALVLPGICKGSVHLQDFLEARKCTCATMAPIYRQFR